MNPFISICIPAYKNPAFLKLLLDSIEMQVFKDFEVIVTDDSPDDEVAQLCRGYDHSLAIKYYKNNPVAGSPANWNRAIEKASGLWIKIMHDDDWFADAQSLQKFATVAAENPSTDFIFSGYTNYQDGIAIKKTIPGNHTEAVLKNSPLNLVEKNCIGHPSTTMVRNNLQQWYDEKTKWVVDIEFYIRCLQNGAFVIIPEPLINIGVSEEQITSTVFGNSAVMVSENIYLLNKLGKNILNRWNIYDHYWRLLRNMRIRNVDALKKAAGDNLIPGNIFTMLQLQRLVPYPLLKLGVISKATMTACYLFQLILSRFNNAW